jgi:flagellar biosynthesis chaperone FliJ
MKRFQFRLQRVLEIRRVQARMEEEALHRLQAARTALRNRLAGLERETAASFEVPLEQQRDAPQYRRFLAGQARKLEGDLSQLGAQIAAQQAKLAEAERRCRLLERLRERARAEWNAAFARELDELAAEAHRARLHAGRGRIQER